MHIKLQSHYPINIKIKGLISMPHANEKLVLFQLAAVYITQ